MFKQAYSYMKANYFKEADSLFQQCSDNINALYWRAVCERSLGQYEEASANLQAYIGSTNTNKKFEEEAKEEWETLQFIGNELKTRIPYW